ncbi:MULTISPECIES: hypothetical protein [Galbibacter]|uniref:Uncharacterized protein n=1 Tax=Galbibacter pacificus TaxID=2996052 RepID=A0ABT6FTL1_9FLAO|nr:hypothetical protein [Galbibacter pacificus]MDG3583122.1 hypothetical protein [Galbibacter pacificus]MDG3586603.1 hypothetical protein [Galbibacter pacificus]
MSAQKRQLGQKIILGVLLLCIAALTGFSYFNYVESEEKVSFLENAKGMIVEDLESIQNELNELAKENESHIKEIDYSRKRIASLMDSIQFLEVDYQILGHYRRELAEIRKENKYLHKVTDSIKKQNFLLSKEIDSTRLRYTELERYSNALKSANENLTQFNDSLINENIELSKQIDKNPALKVSALVGMAYKIRNNGKVIETNRYTKADRLRVCFNIAPGTLLQPGEREFYVQFIDPRHNILGTKKAINFNAKKLVYSKKIVIDYENKPMGICDYIIVKDLDMEGDYRVNIFYKENLLATTVFKLK